MPCRCTGVRLNKCKCLLDAVYPVRQNGSNVVLVARDNTHDDATLHRRLSKRGLFYRLVENMYGKCAEYNLRYCQLRGFNKPGNQLGNTLKDLLILACFIIANFVVFLTIVFKISIHMYFGIKHTACWIQRYLNWKVSNEADTQPALSTGRHDYSPPVARMFT